MASSVLHANKPAVDKLHCNNTKGRITMFSYRVLHANNDWRQNHRSGSTTAVFKRDTLSSVHETDENASCIKTNSEDYPPGKRIKHCTLALFIYLLISWHMFIVPHDCSRLLDWQQQQRRRFVKTLGGWVSPLLAPLPLRIGGPMVLSRKCLEKRAARTCI